MPTDLLFQLVGLLGGATGLVVISGWILRTVLLRLLDRDLEVFKNRLAAQTAMSVEELKSQLERVSKEHEIRFGALQEKRAAVIADLYYRLESTQSSAHLLKRVLYLREQGKVDDEKVKRWIEKTSRLDRGLFKFVQRNKLYFSEALAAKIQKVSFSIQDPLPALLVKSAESDELWGDTDVRRAKYVAYWDEHEAEIRDLMRFIENEFRVLLGSEPQKREGADGSAQPRSAV